MTRRRRALVAGLGLLTALAFLAVFWSGRRRGDDAGRLVHRDGAAALVAPSTGAPRPLRADERPAATTAIAGVVVDDAGPVPDASVALAAGALGVTPRILRATTTDQQGRFQLDGLAVDGYSVIVSAARHASLALAADLRVPASAAWWSDARLDLAGCDASLIAAVERLDGSPLAGARLSIGTRDGVRAALGSTDDDGQLAACVAPGTWVVAVEAPGYGTVQREMTIRRTEHERFALSGGASMTGVLVDAADSEKLPSNELGDCKVWAVSQRAIAESPGVKATIFGACAPDATFEITGLAPGPYNVFAATTRHASDRALVASVSVDADNAVVVPLSTRTAAWGQVVEIDGTAVAGAHVYATAPGGARSRTTVTRADGAFDLALVPGDAATLVVEGRDVVSPRPWDGKAPVRITVSRGGRIHGRVVERGQAVIAARVAVVSADRRREVLTDARGGFAFDVAAGPFALTATSRKGGVAALHGSIDAGALRDVLLELSPPVVIQGRVETAAGEPVVGQALVGFCEGAPGSVGDARSRADGSFTMPLIADSTCTAVRVAGVDASADQGGAPPSALVPIVDGTPTTDCVITVPGGGHLGVRVVDVDGSPVRATVALRGPAAGPAAVASTDAAGVAHVHAIQRGWHTVEVEAPDGRRARRELEVRGDAALEIRLGDDVALVLADDGPPGAPPWRVLVIPTAPGVAAIEVGVAAAGEETLAVARGQYTLLAHQPPGSFVVTTVDAQRGAELRVRLAAIPRRDVEVTVRGFWGALPTIALRCAVATQQVIDQHPMTLRRMPTVTLSTAATTHLAIAGGPAVLTCAGDPAIVSDGVAAIGDGAVAVTVAEPAPRPVRYVVRRMARGLVVTAVLVDASTLRVDDTVLSIDGRDVAGLTAVGLAYALLSMPPGPHRATIERAGVRQEIAVCATLCDPA